MHRLRVGDKFYRLGLLPDDMVKRYRRTLSRAGHSADIPQYVGRYQILRADGGADPLVGEQGAELIDLPKGATVIPLNKSSISIGIEDLNAKVDQLIALIQSVFGQRIGVYLDRKTIVGELAPDLDVAFGELIALKERYA